MTTVVVAGLGYVGLPLAVRAAEAGHQVVGYDIDPGRVKLLAAGESYIEDVPSGQLTAVLKSGAFRPSSEVRACAGFDVAVITVPTPLQDGLPDLTYIEAATHTLARYLRPGATVDCREGDRPARLVTFGSSDFQAILRAKFHLADR